MEQKYFLKAWKTRTKSCALYFSILCALLLGGCGEEKNKKTAQKAVTTYFDFSGQRLDSVDFLKEVKGIENAVCLNLSHNCFHDFPKELATYCPSLQYLSLSHNFLEKIDLSSIQNMTQLYGIDLSHNRLTEITPPQRHLSKLRMLLAHHNSLSQVPISLLPFCPEMRTLDFSFNKIRTIGSLSDAKRLKVLCLSHNRIKKIMRDEIDSLEKLEVLDLGHNQIVSCSTLKLPQSLAHLNLCFNELSTLSCLACHMLPNLVWLDVSFNHLSTLADACHLQGLPVLLHLNLTGNNIVDFDIISHLERRGIAVVTNAAHLEN